MNWFFLLLPGATLAGVTGLRWRRSPETDWRECLLDAVAVCGAWLVGGTELLSLAGAAHQA
jgi:hypothetical protein